MNSFLFLFTDIFLKRCVFLGFKETLEISVTQTKHFPRQMDQKAILDESSRVEYTIQGLLKKRVSSIDDAFCNKLTKNGSQKEVSDKEGT